MTKYPFYNLCSNQTAFLGSLIGGVLGLLGSKSSDKSSAQTATNANEFTKEQLQNRHQWQVEDLKKAGLNPILSAGGTPSIGTSAQAKVHDKSESLTRSGKAAVEIANIKADTNLKTASAKNQSAQSARTQVDTVQKEQFTPIYKSIGDAVNKGVGSAKGIYDTLKSDIGNSYQNFKTQPNPRYKSN